MSTTLRPGAIAGARHGRFASGLEVEVTVTDRWEEVTECLALVHDGFVESGYMDPQPSGMRMILPYLAPGAHFFLARVGGATVGSIVLMPDSAFGLPSDRAFCEEMDALRLRGELWECGSLVVASSWRRHIRLIARGLVAAATRVFITEHLGARCAISVLPGQSRFYEGTVGFRLEVAEPRPLYGAPAVLLQATEIEMREHMIASELVAQRLISDLVMTGEPWLTDTRSGEPWPADHLARLLGEQSCLDRLAGQLGVLRGIGVCPPPGVGAVSTRPA